MTRINSDLDPKILADQHLMAEYNEFGMFFSSLRRSLKSKKGLPKIPDRFTLNSGHVTFFYNKLGFMDEEFIIINSWDLNDANWRSEYFNYGFREIGIEIKIGTPEMNEHFVNFLREEWA